ncbi:MAG: Rne/Rng family ribonuclease [Candidatus Omnitrophica bacterium]|nr:Rne/Rng family ribonuclease [Candidatus Omnitrophota bacterium]
MHRLTKKIIINAGIYESRVAILNNDVLDEFYAEREGTEQFFGNIYKGRIESVVQGIGAAFVNIGTGKNGFLHFSDILERSPEMLDESDDFIIEEKKKSKSSDIGSLLKVGQEILVQVVKESVGTKGPRLTTHLSIPGRYFVLTPFDDSLGISKRISDASERGRIRSILRSLKLQKGIGCIVRTAARGIDERNFKREMKYLLNLWGRVKFRSKKINPPGCLYEEYGLILRTVRDQFTEDVERLIVDSRDMYKKIARFLSFFMPALKARMTLYQGTTHVFEKYGIEEEIEKIFDRKISMKSGGSIVIEQTEGMVAIDVNTEKYKGKKNVEDTIFKTNMEAARAIARQIRLRDMGGIIVIDFIDMKSRSNKMKVQEALESCLIKDKAKTNILSISPIGVVEMTRQRMRKSLESASYKKCPHCNGRGLIKSDTTVAMQILRKIERSSHAIKKRELIVKVHPDIFNYLMNNKKSMVLPLERRCGKRIKFISDNVLASEDVKIE